MSKYLSTVVFLLIVFFSFFVRFYKLGEIPNGLYQDETAIGYNAYSLLVTGRDEFGLTFPLYFKSFGDYKLPVYIYAAVPSIKLFGLTPFAVRFPSAFFGFLTVPLLYFLVIELLKLNGQETINNKRKNRLLFTDYYPLLSALLLAINPWHIHYSRAAFEVTIALFLFLSGTWLLHKAYERKPGYFLAGTVCFLLAFYSYNLTRLLAPILYTAAVYIFHRKGGVRKIEAGATLAISVGLLFPFVQTLFTPGGVGSAGGTFILTSAAVRAPLLELRSYMLALPPLVTKMFFNSYVLTGWQYLANIASYFSAGFFFVSGSPHGNHGIGSVGQFYLFELPVIALGALLMLKEKTAFARLLFVWLSATILVASLTREAPHATRSFFLLLPMVLFSAKGLLSFYTYASRLSPKLRLSIVAAVAAVALYNVVFYLGSYFVRFPVAYAKSWRAADDDVSHFIRDHQNEYDKIIIDRNAGFIYTSILFYNAFPPIDFQQSVRRLPDDREGFSDVSSFGKFEIRDIHEDDFRQSKTLLITTPDRKPDFAQTSATFSYPQRPVVIPVKGEIISYPVQETAYVAVATD